MVIGSDGVQYIDVWVARATTAAAAALRLFKHSGGVGSAGAGTAGVTQLWAAALLLY